VVIFVFVVSTLQILVGYKADIAIMSNDVPFGAKTDVG